LSENKQNTTSDSIELKVSLSYGDLKVDFSGSPESVLRSIDSFVSSQIPAFSLAKKLSLNYSAAELVEKFKDYVRITPEGPRIITESNLSDKEMVAAQLVALKIACETGSSKSSSASLSSLQGLTGLNSKSLSSRLSELSKAGLVVRESSEEGTKFRISTQGITWLKDTLAKKKSEKN
jgi:DNA-binding transcriptional ArsR family regulator